MSNGIFSSGDPTCAITVCGRILAQVDCIKYIMQGTSVCIDIHFFDIDGTPLDLSRFCDIQIQLTNELDCVLANFWYPDVPTGSRGFDIEILQDTTTSGNIINKGIIRICIPSNCTVTSPGTILAEILLKECLTTGEISDSFGITCLHIAKIIESKISKNGGAGGCFPGYIPPLPGSSGIGFAIGATGLTGATGPQGESFSSPYTGNLQINGQLWVTADPKGDTTVSTTVDWNDSNVQTFTLNTETTEFIFSNPNAGATYILIVQQNTAGSQTITWPNNVSWSGGISPIMTTTADRYDVFTFIYDGSKYFGSYIQNFT